MGFEVGQRVADYEIVSLLGVGGMGRVYRVRNVISHRVEAMKVLLADLNAEPELAARFAGEIRTLAGLDHPNIAQLHTALQVDNELVMMMEFVDGSTLQQLAAQAALPQEEIVDYTHQVLAALSFAHNRGVVHRDIKPANIIITPQGIAKLTDFGIAKSKVDDELTRPGTTVGSLYYMSPEQAHGGCAVDARSDIYSVGITLYQLLVGRRPFEDESAYVILHSHLNVEPRPPIELNPLLSKPLSDLILKALEKDPARRFQNAAAFSDALREVTGIGISATLGSGVSRRPAEAAASSRFSTSAHRGLWFAAEALAVLVVLVCTAVGLPHFAKTGAMATTVGHAPAPSFPTVPHDSVAATNSGITVTTPADPTGAPANETAPEPIVVSAPPQPRATAASSSQRAKSAAPKLSRVEFQATALPDNMPEAEESAAPTPSLSPSTTAELQQVRSHKVELDARAAEVRTSVKRLKSQQEAAGDGLSQDVAGAYVRMNAYLSAEKMDLADGDVAAARDHMDKAEYEVNVLENLFKQ